MPCPRDGLVRARPHPHARFFSQQRARRESLLAGLTCGTLTRVFCLLARHAGRSVNVVSGIAALQYLSVPMWSTLRRLTTLITMGGEVMMLSKQHPPEIWQAVVRDSREN